MIENEGNIMANFVVQFQAEETIWEISCQSCASNAVKHHRQKTIVLGQRFDRDKYL